MEPDPSLLDAAEAARRQSSDLERGLSDAEAARRLAELGPNELVAAAATPPWRLFLRQFQDPLVYLLLGAIAVATATWLVEGATGWPFDSLVIAVIVLLNAVLGFVQESRAASAVAALQQMAAATAQVVRDGRPRRIPARDLVPGDLVLLEEGDSVSADARLVAATTLRVSEAPLTGESEAVLKDVTTLAQPAPLGDRLDMVFSGTAVAQGVGRGIVTATGMTTELGHIAGMLEAAVDEPTPLQREIARLGKALGIAVVVIAAIVMAAVLISSDVNSVEGAVNVLLLGVSLAVAAVPEGLPAVLSVVLAIGVQRMARRNAIVKRLSSVETLGSASVICTDKTGTLTQSQMTVQRVVTASGVAEVSGVGYQPQGAVTSAGRPLVAGAQRDEVASVLSGGSLASTARLASPDGDSVWEALGDPTEAALLVAEQKLGTTQRRTERFRRVGLVPFSAARKMMSSLEADAERDGQIAIVTKGAPDVLLTRCTHELVGADRVPLSDVRRGEILGDVERLSDQAFRTLGVAYKPLNVYRPPEAAETLESDLVFAGMVGIIDPPRAEAAYAIAQAQRAGLRVIMITGDHPRTAFRIAADLGIVAPGAAVATGTDLDTMTDDDVARTVRTTDVYARVSPEHKLRIVAALQADQHLVAMTGDGVNDAPALKAADIGVAMGRTGTEVARQSADMILADDNFATIVESVQQGRAIFDNIKKFLRYLLSSNMGEVLTVFLGVVAAGLVGLRTADGGVVLPLLAAQILWVNLLTDAAPALAMGVDPQTDDVMGRPPRHLTDRVIDASMWAGVLFTGLVMAVLTLGTIDFYLPGGIFAGSESITSARTAGFTVLVLAQLFNCFNARSDTTSAFRRLFVNPWLWAAVGVSLLLQVAVVHLPVLNHAFRTTPLTMEQWLVCTAIASCVLWAAELRKLVRHVVG